MYFLVNASLPKRFDLATSNFVDAWLAQKCVFAMVFPRLKSSCFCFLFGILNCFTIVHLFKDKHKVVGGHNFSEFACFPIQLLCMDVVGSVTISPVFSCAVDFPVFVF